MKVENGKCKMENAKGDDVQRSEISGQMSGVKKMIASCITEPYKTEILRAQSPGAGLNLVSIALRMTFLLRKRLAQKQWFST